MGLVRIACVVPPLHMPVNEIGHGYHPPLGLLTVAGPLVDAGSTVRLLDADARHASPAPIIHTSPKGSAETVLKPFKAKPLGQVTMEVQ